MRKGAIRKMDEGKGIGRVSRRSDASLERMGKRDSRKGAASVPDAMLGKMLAKCETLEEKEAIKTLSRTKKARKAATAAVITIKRNYKKSDLQMLTGENGVLSPYDIRENVRRARQNSEKRRETDMAVAVLKECVPELEHAQAMLLQRISATRSKSFTVKANAYIKGVRKGRLPDYKPEIVFSDRGFRLYKEKLGDADEQIFTLFNQIKKGEITI